MSDPKAAPAPDPAKEVMPVQEPAKKQFVTVKQALATLPLPVSEQAFRLAARRLQVNYLSGKSMMLRLEDLPAILRELESFRRFHSNRSVKPSVRSSPTGRVVRAKGRLSPKEQALEMLRKGEEEAKAARRAERMAVKRSSD